MLGETPLPAQPRSIFDYMSQKDKERLENIKHNLTAPRPPSPEAAPAQPAPSHTTGEVNIPQLHPSVAKAALSGFQPFTADPVKHSRYTAFLQFTSQDTTGKKISIDPLPGQSVEGFNKELSDYAKSATVFKPLSGAMAGRFRSAVVIENGPKIIEGLHTPDLSNMQDESEEMKEGAEEDDPRMAAIKLGMYGPLTRAITPWQPARLLCKRFGVKEPELDPADVVATDPNAGSQGKDVSVTEPGVPGTAAAPLAITDSTTGDEGSGESKHAARNLASIGLGDDETQGQDTLTYQRPAMDIFKAIFASDDEDSDDEDAADAKEGSLEPQTAPLVSDPLTAIKVEPTPSTVLSRPNEVEEKVDLATFKPTFIPRSERDSRKDKDKDREKDKKKKKKSKPAVVSFDDGEEDGGLQVNVAALKAEKRKKDRDKDDDRKKKKHRKDTTRDEEDDDSMWMEKPAPEAVQNIDLNAIAIDTSQDTVVDAVAGPPRGRKRAVDFM